jgi:hypothetical protein
VDYETNTQSQKPTESTNQGDEVSEAIKAYKADDKGKVVIPEGTPAHVATALKLEQRRRDLNSNYGKERTKAERLAAENEALKQKMAELATPSGLSAQQAQELEELKFTDPDAWFEKKLALENLNKTQAAEKVNEAVQHASQVAETAYKANVTKSRDEAISDMLNTHNAANPDKPLTLEMMNLNVPPILVNKYQSGELDAPEFLSQVSKFVYADRVVKTEEVLGQPSLSNASSTNAPSEKAETQSIEQIYAGL